MGMRLVLIPILFCRCLGQKATGAVEQGTFIECEQWGSWDNWRSWIKRSLNANRLSLFGEQLALLLTLLPRKNEDAVSDT